MHSATRHVLRSLAAALTIVLVSPGSYGQPADEELVKATETQARNFSKAMKQSGHTVSTSPSRARDQFTVRCERARGGDADHIVAVFYVEEGRGPRSMGTWQNWHVNIGSQLGPGWQARIVDSYPSDESAVSNHVRTNAPADEEAYLYVSARGVAGKDNVYLTVSTGTKGATNYAGMYAYQIAPKAIVEGKRLIGGVHARCEALLREVVAAAEGRLVVEKRVPPIKSEAIDKYLDLWGVMLSEAANDVVLPPSPLDPRGEQLGPGTLTVEEAAGIGRAVWDIAHGLIRAHIAKELRLTEEQKHRCKAFGFWADWLRRRAQNPWSLSVAMDRPEYPFHGPVGDDPGTPPQLKGEDLWVISIPGWGPEAATSDYVDPALTLVFQLVDMAYTRGLLSSAYVAVTAPDDMGRVAATAVPWIPYVGPVLSASYISYQQINAGLNFGRYQLGSISEEEYESKALSWTEDGANLLALGLMGVHVRRNLSTRATRARPEMGIDEGAIGTQIGSKHGGKSYTVRNQTRKRLPDGREVDVAEVTYEVVGKHQGAQAQAPFTTHRRKVAVFRDPDGKQRFFDFTDETLGDPVFFLGQDGYHIWTHLTEVKSGHKTPFTSLIDAFQDQPSYLGELRRIEKIMRDPRKSLTSATEGYVTFANRLVGDRQFQQKSDFYAWTRRLQDGSRQPVGNPEANYFVRVKRATSDPNQYAVSSVRVSIDPNSNTLKNVFVYDPSVKATGADDWMSKMVQESLRKDWFAWTTREMPKFRALASYALGEQHRSD